MAKYDFDQLIPRRGTNSVKWDEEPAADILPMWVADMDFRTAPCVVEALRRRVEHGVYGYATVPESYYGAVTSWFARRHGWTPGADWILPVTGVIPALSAILRALTRPGDRVLVLTPVYNHFFIAIDNSGCSAAECELTYGDNRYTVDFDALERRGVVAASSLWSYIPDAAHSAAGLWFYELARDTHLWLQSFQRPELSVRGLVFAYDTELARKVGIRTDIIRGEDGSLALGLKPYGRIAFVRSRRARAVTGYGTVSKDGTLLDSFRVRAVKALKGLGGMFFKKSEYKDEEDNLLK